MSDDEDFMADRRGIKRAHESPKKINILFEGEALDVGDECSVESDDYPEDWNEHFKCSFHDLCVLKVKCGVNLVVSFPRVSRCVHRRRARAARPVN